MTSVASGVSGQETTLAVESDGLAARLGLGPEPFESAEEAFAAQLTRIEAGVRDDALPFAEQLLACRHLLRNNALRWLLQAETDATRKHDSTLKTELNALRATLPPCMPFIVNGDQALRDLLEQWAEAGNVPARAVFALWAPHWDVQHPSLETLRRWEALALEFSLANLMQGESLGFEAFAESFERGHFTPVNLLLSLDFRVAALRCGLSGPDRVLDVLRLRLSMMEYEVVPGTIHDLLDRRSDRLRAYCRSGRWMDADALSMLLRDQWKS